MNIEINICKKSIGAEGPPNTKHTLQSYWHQTQLTKREHKYWDIFNFQPYVLYMLPKINVLEYNFGYSESELYSLTLISDTCDILWNTKPNTIHQERTQMLRYFNFQPYIMYDTSSLWYMFNREYNLGYCDTCDLL